MLEFAFLLKTYEKDYGYAERLLTSLEKHNTDNIHCFVVLPGKTKKQLIETLDDKVKLNMTFLNEEDFSGLVSMSIAGVSAGYINQEIIKLSFWEKGLCHNYFCLDSEAVFIRDFSLADFMYNDTIPYSVLIEDNDLRSDPVYYHSFWIGREKSLNLIKKELDFEEGKLLTCHGFQNFSGDVLADFKRNYMEPRGYDYAQLMQISPYEFTWYNIWMQKSRVIEIHPCEPIFKTYHMKHHLIDAWMNGITIDDLARSYVGIVINSNYLDGKMISYDDMKEIRKGWFQVLKRIIRYYIMSFRKKVNK